MQIVFCGSAVEGGHSHARLLPRAHDRLRCSSPVHHSTWNTCGMWLGVETSNAFLAPAGSARTPSQSSWSFPRPASWSWILLRTASIAERQHPAIRLNRRCCNVPVTDTASKCPCSFAMDRATLPPVVTEPSAMHIQSGMPDEVGGPNPMDPREPQPRLLTFSKCRNTLRKQRSITPTPHANDRRARVSVSCS